MVLTELIFNSLYTWEGVVVLKELIFHSFNLRGCCGPDITDFLKYL